jgi:hypothetical protein
LNEDGGLRCNALMSFSRTALLVLGLNAALQAADTRLVRETDALTPEQERAALHVPPEFEVQLFASEPMINKPINMAFDAKGRLWVSSTVEYPYAADKGRWSDPQGTHVKGSRDAIKILEDTDGDGKRRQSHRLRQRTQHSHRRPPLAQTRAQGRLHRLEHPEHLVLRRHRWRRQS